MVNHFRYLGQSDQDLAWRGHGNGACASRLLVSQEFGQSDLSLVLRYRNVLICQCGCFIGSFNHVDDGRGAMLFEGQCHLGNRSTNTTYLAARYDPCNN